MIVLLAFCSASVVDGDGNEKKKMSTALARNNNIFTFREKQFCFASPGIGTLIAH